MLSLDIMANIEYNLPSIGIGAIRFKMQMPEYSQIVMVGNYEDPETTLISLGPSISEKD